MQNDMDFLAKLGSQLQDALTNLRHIFPSLKRSKVRNSAGLRNLDKRYPTYLWQCFPELCAACVQPDCHITSCLRMQDCYYCLRELRTFLSLKNADHGLHPLTLNPRVVQHRGNQIGVWLPVLTLALARKPECLGF